MLNEELSALRLLDQRDKNGAQLSGFIFQGRQLLRTNDAGVFKQLDPIERFLQLHQTGVHLRGIFGGRTTANRLPIVSTDGGPAAKQLVTQHPRRAALRQRVVQFDDSQCVASSAILQILHRLIKPETRNQKPEKPCSFRFRLPLPVFGLWSVVSFSGFWFLVSGFHG
jgi:hypothetical protein